MAAGKYDFIIEQGATFQVKFTYQDAALNPISLVGCVVRMHARRKITDPEILLDVSTVNGKVIMDEASQGIIKIIVSAAETASFTWRAAVYDIEVTYPDGVIDRILEGKISISLNVTR
jgi:hypothetical protein